jgi:hypothetical protein
VPRRRSLFRSPAIRLAALLAVAAVTAGVGPAATSRPAAEVPVRAALRLSRLVGDHMVLPRDVPVPVWGWAAPGAAVRVTFGGHSYGARANAAGEWAVTLRPMPAGGPDAMTVASEGGRRAIRGANLFTLDGLPAAPFRTDAW